MSCVKLSSDGWYMLNCQRPHIHTIALSSFARRTITCEKCDNNLSYWVQATIADNSITQISYKEKEHGG